jgi:TrmH family RNA methyltransferase
MKKITSSDNPTFKALEKLKLKKYRDENDKFLVFGEDIVLEAKLTNSIETIFCVDSAIDKYLEAELSFPESLFSILQGNNDHQIGALVKKTSPKDITSSKQILVLDDIQDPSNLGMLLRSAVSFGFSTVIRSRACADYYNEKAIRASKGALFHLNLLTSDLSECLESLYKQSFSIIISEVSKKTSNSKLNDKIALVLGNEGSGVKEDLKKANYHYKHIETKGFESLNVAVAGSILMYELSK